MTGQVKEDVLARLGELGVEVRAGRLGFAPELLPRSEFLPESAAPLVWTLAGRETLALDPDTLAFTVCQVPVVYRLAGGGDAARVAAVLRDGSVRAFEGAFLDLATSHEVFGRTGAVARIEVDVPVEVLVDVAGAARSASTTTAERAS
jgi:hypothetical protein